MAISNACQFTLHINHIWLENRRRTNDLSMDWGLFRHVNVQTWLTRDWLADPGVGDFLGRLRQPIGHFGPGIGRQPGENEH